MSRPETLRYLPFVAPEVEDFERAKRFPRSLELALDLNQPLTSGVNAELSQVGGDPLAAYFSATEVARS